MEVNSAKYKMRSPRIPYLFKLYRFVFWQLLHQYSWLFWGFHLDITVGNLQHHCQLSKTLMKLNSAKYKMHAQIILNWFDKYRFDFWQLLHQYSWLFWGFHLDIRYMGTFSFNSCGAHYVFSRIRLFGLFDNLEWWWRFLTNIYQGKNPKISAVLFQDLSEIQSKLIR